MHKILIVDDQKDILELVKMILESKNFVVHTISNWRDLSQSIIEFTPDLLLLDISLGGIDGRNICKQLKANTEIYLLKLNREDWACIIFIPAHKTKPRNAALHFKRFIYLILISY